MIELGFLIDEETEFKKTLLSFVFVGITSRYMSKINPEEYIDDLTIIIKIYLFKPNLIKKEKN
jgi:hypothetical protein